ncbi:phage portal protein [Promicromonospora alba]|uniref:Phage portal protein n=1 Tax=Promicromonospora alba TaxID=1616110 RepID=A0ABV9HS80_9MICO
MADIFGDLERFPPTRADAMLCGPVVKGRALIAGTISRLPLYAARGEEQLSQKEQPTFLYRSNTAMGPRLRLLLTMDDLLFYGDSLWAVERGAAGQIVDAYRVDRSRWYYDTNDGTTILLDGKDVDSRKIIHFIGPQEGLLDIAGIEIRSYIDLLKVRAARLRNPAPATRLVETQEQRYTPEELDILLDGYKTNHKADSDSVVHVPFGLNLEEGATQTVEMFDGQANQLALAFAEKMSIEPELIGGALDVSSIEYQNQQGKRSWFIDMNLAYWLDPILETLSKDNVVPKGQSVRADLSGLVALPQPENTEVRED